MNKIVGFELQKHDKHTSYVQLNIYSVQSMVMRFKPIVGESMVIEPSDIECIFNVLLLYMEGQSNKIFNEERNVVKLCMFVNVAKNFFNEIRFE